LQLLEEDVALKRFKSYKNSVKQVSKIGNVLTLAVAVGMPLYLCFFFLPFSFQFIKYFGHMVQLLVSDVNSYWPLDQLFTPSLVSCVSFYVEECSRNCG
jgi:hypothetical protein